MMYNNAMSPIRLNKSLLCTTDYEAFLHEGSFQSLRDFKAVFLT